VLISGLLLGGLSNSIFKIPGTRVEIPMQGALFKALQSNRILNVLSAPNILTTDNKKAEIIIGKNVPFLTATQIDANGKPVNSLSREKVALRLAITPQINEGDSVTLDIELKAEEIDKTIVQKGGQSQLAQITNERSIKSTIVAENGQTIVIGGLIKDSSNKIVKKVPLLGDIPILGYLFRQTVVEKEKINLMLFLTPHVIHEPADMTRVSVKKNNERRRFNKTHGIGENKALYDYDLDSGLNMAVPAKASKARERRRRRFDYDQYEEESRSSSVDDYARGRNRRNSKFNYSQNPQFEDEEENSPRSRRSMRRPNSSSNPFADIRPPSSN